MKTRYAKPFENIQVKIPYNEGMSPYSGLFEYFEKKGILAKTGNSYIFTTRAGDELKYFKKKWEKNTDGCLDILMAEITMNAKIASLDEPEIEEEVIDEVVVDEVVELVEEEPEMPENETR